MFARVVTLLRFEIPRALVSSKARIFNRRQRRSQRTAGKLRNLPGWFLAPPLTGKLKRTSVPACQTNVCRGFWVFRSVTGVYLSRLQKWVLANVYRGCHAVTLGKMIAKMGVIFIRSAVSDCLLARFFPWIPLKTLGNQGG